MGKTRVSESASERIGESANRQDGARGLPDGWELASVRDVFEIHYGKGLVQSNRDESGEFPVYGSSGVVGHHSQALIDGPSIVVGRKGAVGRVYYSPAPCWPIDTTYYIQPPRGISLEYLYYVLGFMELAALDKSTAIPGLNRDDFYAQMLPIPPSSEQRCIVAEIETQFTRLDAGVAALERARANLRRYRAAVLKAACEGRLVPTEAELARAEGREYESADQLLAHILAERRAKWEAERWEKEIERAKKKAAQAQRKAAGLAARVRGLTDEEWQNISDEEYESYLPKSDKWKQKYKEPASPKAVDLPKDSSDLPELPERWVWVTLDQLAWLVKDGPHYSPQYVDEGIPFITGGNVRPGGVDFSNVKYISPELQAELSKRCRPEKGDILYTKGGTTGIARVNTYDIEFNVWVHVAVLKLACPIDPFYVQHALNSPLCYAQAQKYTHGVGNQDLGLTRMINIIIALPPLAEQHRIVAEVERRLSVVEALERAVEAGLARARRLRQAVLKQAFEGRLVEQDPDDELASVLLERIRAERAVGKKAERTNRKRKQSQQPQLPLD